MPIVVSVPNIIKCLSLSETIDATDAVGAPDSAAALVVKAALLALIGFQENVLPFFAVAISCCPKLSNDQLAGSSITAEVPEAVPHPVKFCASVTVAPLECACPFEVPGVAVPLAPLVIPVKSLL